MKICQVEAFYKNKEDEPCKLTEYLIKNGYQQKGGGYIKIAREEGLIVDYNQALPSQYWHLMQYCKGKNPNNLFTRRIQCGELLFWMAEVSGYADKDKMEEVLNEVLEDVNNRRRGNKKIKDLCFDIITKAIESSVIE